MKASLVLAVIVISTGYSGAVLAEESCRTVGSCRSNYENCLTAIAGTPAQCKMLYQASIKEGGVWGSPKARTASKTTGDKVYCHVDFE